jgi:hypothetical protein
VEVETTHRAARASVRPLDTQNIKGAYRVSLYSSTRFGDSPLVAFRNPGSNYAVVKRLSLQAIGANVPFPGYSIISGYVIRNIITPVSGGLVMASGSGCLFRGGGNPTAFDFRIASGAALTAGVYTTDPNSFVDVTQSWVSLGTPIVGAIQRTTPLLNAMQGDHPLIIGPNEGFIINVLTPTGYGVGSVQSCVDLEWDEVSTFGPSLAA